MSKLVRLAAIFLLLGFAACAQEVRHEITVQGSGFFPNQTTANGITSNPTYSGGVMAGYRFNLNRWLAVEGDYDYFRNGQKFFATSGTSRVGTNVHAVTGTGVVKLPTLQKFRPFVLAGGGAMVFDPHDTLASTGKPEVHSYTAAEVIIRCSDMSPSARSIGDSFTRCPTLASTNSSSISTRTPPCRQRAW